jgi:hypothetical protein
MTIPVAAATPHTDAVLAAIRAIPMLAERGIKPATGGWQGNPGTSTFLRYAVVWPSPGVPDGNLAEPLEYLDYTAQINVYGATATQSEQAADAIRAALIGRRLTVAGRTTYRVQSDGGAPLIRDDGATPALYMAVVEIKVRSQPA